MYIYIFRPFCTVGHLNPSFADSLPNPQQERKRVSLSLGWWKWEGEEMETIQAFSLCYPKICLKKQRDMTSSPEGIRATHLELMINHCKCFTAWILWLTLNTVPDRTWRGDQLLTVLWELFFSEVASSNGRRIRHKPLAVSTRHAPTMTSNTEKFVKPSAPNCMSTPHQWSSCHSKFLPTTIPRVPPACIRVKALPSHPAGACSCWSTVTGKKVKALPNSFAAFSNRAAGSTSISGGRRIKIFATKGTGHSFKQSRRVSVARRSAEICFR